MKRITSSIVKNTVQMKSRKLSPSCELLMTEMVFSSPLQVTVLLKALGDKSGMVSRQKPAMEMVTNRKEMIP